ncbi:Na(+)-translocating NADH-quinone reductase subunit B [hydrothermal vent metagenome]|uniref:Na(+)-translocating NADH-quinone reductase subunit B n=1 Tax=hydrothermal vent metagenome TaxID=652676 RepID=A0A3B1E920_9ZZZZ
MKFMRGFLDRIEPSFKEGGKLEKLFPLYEMVDTFLYSPPDITRGASHVRDGIDLKRMMGTVAVALLPCIFMAFYNTGLQANLAMAQLGLDTTVGWRGSIIHVLGVGYNPNSFMANIVHGGLFFLPVFLVCNIVGGVWEALFATIRKHEINEGFLVTGLLFPLILPPTIPLWQVAVGISFGVVFGKEVFGGTGKNFLNPALTARAFLYFAQASSMSGDAVWTAVDGNSGATPLGAIANAPLADTMKVVTENLGITFQDAFWGTLPGSMGETSVAACLIGAFILIITGIGSWRIMLAVIGSAFGFALLFHGMGSSINPRFAMPANWHLVVGGLAFGAVFMATDPVSAAMTNGGKWVYGILIGFMTILIRLFNPGYAEGIMLAILFGNVFAPTIDYYVVQANIRRRIARNAT